MLARRIHIGAVGAGAETHAADVYPPPPAPPAASYKIPWPELVQRALAHGTHWQDASISTSARMSCNGEARMEQSDADRMVPVRA